MTSVATFPRQRPREIIDEWEDDGEEDTPEEETTILIDELQAFKDDGVKEGEDDTTTAGHLMLMRQREKLTYMRLIEHEMPKLVGELDYINDLA